jgi:hypothetical protein
LLILDNTNNLKFELYVVHVEVDGMGFLLSYLFLENNGNCGNGIRTGVIIDFLLKLKTLGLEPEFFITNKDLHRFLQHGLYGKILRYNCASGT